MYVKVFSSMLDSSVWQYDNATRIVWITLLLMADREGHVFASLPGIAHRARVNLQDAETALRTLAQPDPHDQSGEHDGRRIVSAKGGLRIVNYRHYRSLADADVRRQQTRDRVRKHRETKGVTLSNAQKRHAEAEAESELSADKDAGASSSASARTRRKSAGPSRTSSSTVQWSPDNGWQGIQDSDRRRWDAAYPACNLDRQLAAMDAWLRSNPAKAHKKRWDRFVTNWLSRSQDRGGDTPTTPKEYRREERDLVG